VEMLMREHAWVGFRYGRWFGLDASEGARSTAAASVPGGGRAAARRRGKRRADSPTDYPDI